MARDEAAKRSARRWRPLRDTRLGRRVGIVGWVLAILAVITSSAVVLASAPAAAEGETLAITLGQVDGTPGWSADDEPGHDSGGSNGIVRTNDNLIYQVEVAVNDAPATNVTFTVGLAQARR